MPRRSFDCTTAARCLAMAGNRLKRTVSEPTNCLCTLNDTVRESVKHCGIVDGTVPWPCSISTVPCAHIAKYIPSPHSDAEVKISPKIWMPTAGHVI